MFPTKFDGYTVEQLRGFAKANDDRIADLRSEGLSTDDGDKIASLEGALDYRDQLNAAIEAALAAEGDDTAEPDATGDADGDAGTEDDADAGDGEDGDEAGDADADADATVDEAVASARMGGGDVPRSGKEHISVFEPRDVASFLRSTAGSRMTPGSRMQFATLRRQTNHVATRGEDITSKLAQIIADRVSGDDRTAAGCFCGPDEARTEICRALVSERPFSDTLPTVTGGDFRFIRQIDLEAAAAGVTVWDCDDQADVDPADVGTWKPCFRLDCQTEIETETYAVPACATFDTQAMIGNPNLIANLEHVMTVAYNRAAELEAYNRVLAEASQVNYNLHALTSYGASAKLILAVGWAMEAIRKVHRDKLEYDLVLPAGLRERVLADGEVRGFGDYRTWDDVVDRLTALGVRNIVELYDPIGVVNALPAAGGPAVDATPHTLSQQILLYRPDNFLLGVGETIDMGIVASSINELRKNELNWFTESFESVTRCGIQPTVAINADFCDNGARPALGEPRDCTPLVA